MSLLIDSVCTEPVLGPEVRGVLQQLGDWCDEEGDDFRDGEAVEWGGGKWVGVPASVVGISRGGTKLPLYEFESREERDRGVASGVVADLPVATSRSVWARWWIGRWWSGRGERVLSRMGDSWQCGMGVVREVKKVVGGKEVVTEEVKYCYCGLPGCGRVECFRQHWEGRRKKAKRHLKGISGRAGLKVMVTLSSDWGMDSGEREARGWGPKRRYDGGVDERGRVRSVRARLMRPDLVGDEVGGVRRESLLAGRMESHLADIGRMRGALRGVFRGGFYRSTEVNWLEPESKSNRWMPCPHTHFVGVISEEWEEDLDGAVEVLTAAWKKACAGWDHEARPVNIVVWSDEYVGSKKAASYLTKGHTVTAVKGRYGRCNWKPRQTELATVLDLRSLVEWLHWTDVAGYGAQLQGMWGVHGGKYLDEKPVTCKPVIPNVNPNGRNLLRFSRDLYHEAMPPAGGTKLERMVEAGGVISVLPGPKVRRLMMGSLEHIDPDTGAVLPTAPWYRPPDKLRRALLWEDYVVRAERPVTVETRELLSV